MNDLISKEVVIETLKAVRDLVWDVDIPSPTVPEYIEHHEQMQSIMRNIDILTDKIIKMPSVQPEWIPCSEKLPYAEYGESPNVYCYCYDPDLGGKWTQLLYYDGGVWCLPTGETFEYKVLAWYPLPTKPYKGDKDETD